MKMLRSSGDDPLEFFVEFLLVVNEYISHKQILVIKFLHNIARLIIAVPDLLLVPQDPLARQKDILLYRYLSMT